METTLGKLIQEYRLNVNLTQQGLGRKIGKTGSTISRFETGDLTPTASTLQGIINALALEGVARDKLDQLWQAAGYHRSDILQAPVADPVVSFIHQVLADLTSEERLLLSDDLRSVVEIDQAYLSSKRALDRRKWLHGAEELQSLRLRVEARVQHWYLRVDEALGKCRHHEGRYAEAIQFYESALWSAYQLKDSYRQAEILIQLGDSHRRRGGSHWTIALDRYTEARGLFEELGDLLRVADCVRRIAAVHLFRGRADEALPLCEESLRISREQHYERGVYKALQHLVWTYNLFGRWDEAVQAGEEALSIVQTLTSDPWELAKAYRYLADSYRLKREIKEAQSAYEKALQLLKPHEHEGSAAKLLLGMIRLGVAKVYLKQPGKELEAKKQLNLSLQAHQDLGEDFRIGDVLGEQGELLLRLGRFDEAEVRLMQAKERFERLDNIFHYAIASSTLCELYYQKGLFGQLCQLASDIESKDNGLINYQLCRIWIILGKSYISQGMHRESREIFQIASQRAVKVNRSAFREVIAGIIEQAERLAVEETPELAIELCKSIENFWNIHDDRSDMIDIIDESLEILRKTQYDLAILTAIT